MPSEGYDQNLAMILKDLIPQGAHKSTLDELAERFTDSDKILTF